MNRSTSGRVQELETLFARCRHQWRDLFFELENGDASLLSEDPWHGLDDFLASTEAEHRGSFTTTLVEMVKGGDAVEQAQALSIVAACNEPFDLAVALAIEPELKKDLEAHLAFLLAVGEDARGERRDPRLREAFEQSAREIDLEPQRVERLPALPQERATQRARMDGASAAARDPCGRLVRRKLEPAALPGLDVSHVRGLYCRAFGPKEPMAAPGRE